MTTYLPPRRALYDLSMIHALHDMFTGAWYLILAYQVSRLDLSYTQSGIAAMLFMIASSIAQPAIGHYFDRQGKAYLALWGTAITAVMSIITGLVNSYSLILLAGIGTGIGSASFHAGSLSGSQQVAAGRGQGRTTAIFLLGGNGGNALGAYLSGAIIASLGMMYLIPPALLTVLVTPFFVAQLSPYMRSEPCHHHAPTQTFDNHSENTLNSRVPWKIILAFVLIIFTREIARAAFTTYLPQFFKAQGELLAYAGRVSSGVLFFLALGSFVGGNLADHFPRRRVVFFSLSAIAPLGFLLLRSSGLTLTLLSFALGLSINISHPILLMVGQEIFPGGKSRASGFSFGLVFFFNAMGNLVIGPVADAVGLIDALSLASIIPLTTILLVILLPGNRKAKSDVAQMPIEEADSPESSYSGKIKKNVEEIVL